MRDSFVSGTRDSLDGNLLRTFSARRRAAAVAFAALFNNDLSAKPLARPASNSSIIFSSSASPAIFLLRSAATSRSVLGFSFGVTSISSALAKEMLSDFTASCNRDMLPREITLPMGTAMETTD